MFFFWFADFALCCLCTFVSKDLQAEKLSNVIERPGVKYRKVSAINFPRAFCDLCKHELDSGLADWNLD